MSKEREIPSYLVPDEVARVTETLEKAGFEAYLVGGCVRDMLMGKDPEDWDIATNAEPTRVQELFPHTYYENNFGTVGVISDDTDEPSLKKIEVTTYRKEGSYSDSRRPDSVQFTSKIEEDLERRDFTMNAIALGLPGGIKDISKGHLIDPYKGHSDIKDKLIRTVLDPEKRFNEDALRILRAIRFEATLGFLIEEKTEKSIERFHMKLSEISKERIRDEFVKIVMSKRPEHGLTKLKKYNLLQFIVPELEAGDGIEQGGIHSYDVWEHSVKSLQAAADKNFPLETRLAALLHDIGKPKTRRAGGKNKKWSFFGHDVVGERVTRGTLTNLMLPKETIETVSNLVRWHMFFSDTEQITHSAVRRVIQNVGKEHIWNLIDLRICDRIGTGRPKEEPYRLRKYKAMIEEVMRDPISVGMLKIDGKGVMDVTHETPGPKIGYILNALLEEVLEDPKLNTEEYLQGRASDLSKLDDFELIALALKGKTEKQNREEEEIKKIRDKNWVE